MTALPLAVAAVVVTVRADPLCHTAFWKSWMVKFDDSSLFGGALLVKVHAIRRLLCAAWIAGYSPISGQTDVNAPAGDARTGTTAAVASATADRTEPNLSRRMRKVPLV